MERIDSLQNTKIKSAVALKSRRGREKSGCFSAEGIRLVEMAARSDWPVLFAFVTDKASRQERVQEILHLLAKKGTLLATVSDKVMSHLSLTESPQGILAVMKKKERALNALLPDCKDSPCFMVIDGVQDPGNLGTMIRTADASGADGVILLKGTVDVFNPKVVRAAMGSMFALPMATEVSPEDFLSFSQKCGLKVFATALDEAARPHFEADFRQPTALVFGNEGNGVSEKLLASAERIFIPMFGQAESLNVAVSAAIVLYEALRQRHQSCLSSCQ